ncbi:MAG: gamma-glutamyl-gamma-aminobutyrate hydrolase family protein [Chloroflexia bacterium]
MKPVIGITPSIGAFENRGEIFRMEVSYVQAVEAAGGVPILLPPSGAGVEELVGIVDGIIFSGGADIRPDRYGDDYVHEKTYGISDLRDEFEFQLLEAALRADVPTLAICRGIQVLNVALGGTLYQDIPTEYPTDLKHSQPWEVGSYEHPIHEVAVERDSLLGDLLDATTVGTNSAHHQSLKQVPPSLRVIGRSTDGSIEAVEHIEKRFVLGVQWHPEKMFVEHTEHLRLFAGLIEEARAHRARRELGAVAAD